MRKRLLAGRVRECENKRCCLYRSRHAWGKTGPEIHLIPGCVQYFCSVCPPTMYRIDVFQSDISRMPSCIAVAITNSCHLFFSVNSIYAYNELSNWLLVHGRWLLVHHDLFSESGDEKSIIPSHPTVASGPFQDIRTGFLLICRHACGATTCWDTNT